MTKIFHPNVSKSGEICVNTLKKDWTSEVEIRQIFLTIKCLLIAPNPESALNEEAGRLLLEDYDSYYKHAKLLTSIHAQNQSFDKICSDSAGSCSISSLDEALNVSNGSNDSPSLSSSPKKRVLPEKPNKKRTLRRL